MSARVPTVTGMPSSALASWSGDRSKRLDRLEKAHESVRPRGPGRKWETDELSQAILLRLATEFQGFCRSLHDECVDAVAATCGSATSDRIFRLALIRDRTLDRGNASPGNLGDDFGRLGMAFWPDISARYPRRGAHWNRTVHLLNTARNGIAHDDNAKLAELQSSGWPLTLTTARRWRRTLNGTAHGMDTVCAEYLAEIVGEAPW